MEQKYYKVTKIAEIFGIPAKTIRDMCHARGQRFAFRPVKNGNWLIDRAKFEKHLEHKTE
ncbi:MAG: helix-turn-helix domain-containing protein [Lachnospiraceae bacterium]|nr:helix-turn-helix domain-containing protein [Lachnospiraceae bacterium]